MEKQISAVEWLENEFQEALKDFGGLHTDFIERFEQAKQMEEKQQKKHYDKGHSDAMNKVKRAIPRIIK